MRRILHDLDLAIYRCNVSIQNLESALDVSAFELSDVDAVLQRPSACPRRSAGRRSAIRVDASELIPMDYSRIIRELQDEKARVDAAIAQLEALAGSGDGNLALPRSRRGRKSMGPAERREVSARMKKYWASRRKAKGSE